MAGERTFVVKLLSEFSPKGIDKAIHDFKKLETNGERAGYALKKSFVPALAVLGGIAAGLGLATKAAVEDQAAQEQLAGVLERATGATAKAVRENERWIASLSRATATADDDLRPALASLANATGDLGEAQGLLTVAQDLAAATNSDLGTAVDALSKAYNGNMKGLRALDPALMDVIKSGASFNEVMGVLADRTGGAAVDAANTMEGKARGLKIAFDEMKESIGMALLPVLESLIKILEPMAQWAQDNSTLFLVLIGVVGGLAAAVVAANIVLKLHAAWLLAVKIATWAWNAALAANPVVAIGVGVAALTALFVVLEVKTGLISKAFDRFGVALIPIIGLVGTLVGLLARAIQLKDDLVNTGKSAGKSILGSLISPIPGINLGGLLDKIPGLASGGVVTRPTLAMVGEAGPEAVVPLSKFGGGGDVYNINIHSVVADERLPGIVVDALRSYNRSVGRLNVAV